MSFVSVPGLKGKVYVPDESREGCKKYPCRDCFSCQQCGDDRCRVCLSLKPGKCHDELKSIKDGPALSKGMAPCGCGVME